MLISGAAGAVGSVAGQIAGWLSDGSLIAREEVVTGGVRRFPEALLMLFSGANTGKLVLQVA